MVGFDKLEGEIIESINSSNSLENLESIRILYIGQNGLIKNELKTLAKLPLEEKKSLGSRVNQLYEDTKVRIQQKKIFLQERILEEKLHKENLDVTLPVRPFLTGKIHPISHAISEALDIFTSMGFEYFTGPEIEDSYHAFDALNTPAHHPARQAQDTFYLENDYLLRPHTSSLQIRYMKQHTPPFCMVTAGRVYRNDWDATHTPMFHQIEGFYVDKGVDMANLKYCLNTFLSNFFGSNKNRFRPSFFPFTEPSAEVDIACSKKDGKILIGGNDWMEVLGCGMIHKNVLKNVGIDPQQYTGFAFGMGVERLAMLKYKISDLRQFYENDLRWLQHYGFNF